MAGDIQNERKRPNLSEGLLARGWQDTKRGLASWQFWALEVFGGGFLGIWAQNAVIVLVFVGGMFLLLWLGATATAPVRQRNDLRRYAEATVADDKPRLVVQPIIERMAEGHQTKVRLQVENPSRFTVRNVTVELGQLIDANGIEQRTGQKGRALGKFFRAEGYFQSYGPDTYKVDIGPKDKAIYAIVNAHAENFHVFLVIRDEKMTSPDGQVFYSLSRDDKINAEPYTLITLIRGEDIIPIEVRFSIIIRDLEVFVDVTED